MLSLAATKAGLSGINVHSSRHSAASALMEAGVNIKAVSDMLGHSSVAITGDIYGHTSDQTAQLAADTLARVFKLRIVSALLHSVSKRSRGRARLLGNSL